MKPLYIFDLDGTLSLADHRRHLVEAPKIKCPKCNGDGTFHKAVPKDTGELAVWTGDCDYCKGKGAYKDSTFKPDWDMFFKASALDAPNWPVCGLMMQLYQLGCDIQIWSGRDEAVRDITVQWLFTHLAFQPHVANKLLAHMRPTGDFTPDEQMKQAWLNKMPKPDRERLSGVFDDRDKVVAMWRKNGLTCFQVAPGNF